MRTPRSTSDTPPPEVAADPAALATWTATVAALREAGLWTAADRAVVTRYSLLSSLWAAAQRDVTEGGTMMKTQSGYESVRVSAVLVTKLAAAMLAIESAIGLNARGRSRLKPSSPNESDAVAKERAFLRRVMVRA